MTTINQDSLDFPQTTSNLSPYFQKLICEACLTNNKEPRVLNKDGFLDFDFMTRCFPESLGPESDSHAYFTDSVKILAPMLHSVEEWFISHAETNFFNKLTDWTSWTNQQKMMSDLFAMMLTHEDMSDISVLLAATAILERALGDVYLITGPAPCPSMLKDLLVSRPLTDLLGHHVIQVLRLVIGPPISLNIRNVTWHGFPLPGEIPQRCIWFILLLVPSIGFVLHSKGITNVKHREPVNFPEVSLIQDQDLVLNDDMVNILTTSRLMTWKTEQFWSSVRKLLYEDGKYSLCAGLLCYYLEQGLRRVFAVVNNCENRILTAESSTLFTTFDEMLNPYLPDNTENKLRYVLGDSIIEILMDLLVYQDGPRLRDRLSHGEADWYQFPRSVTCNLLTVCIALTVRFTDKYKQDGQIDNLQTCIQTYTVQFHRISLIKKMVSQLYEQAADFDSHICLNTDLTQREDGHVYGVSEDHLKFEDTVKRVCNEVKVNWSNHSNILEQDQIVESIIYKPVRDCWSVNTLRCIIPTLYRGAKPMDPSDDSQVDGESEVLSILDHVITECLTTLTQLRNFACLRQQQYRDKQLRSRQRENFKKFLIRYWKSILQCCENLRTFTHPDKNKWTEGLDLINKHVTHLMSTINKLLLK